MSETTLASTGLMSKISDLFNNPLFSDVEIVFTNGSSHQRMYGHKLILSLRSKAFAHMFYEQKIEWDTIQLPAKKQSSFFLLFKFLYTDDVQFRTFEEAQDLCELATAYAVDELVEKCNSYLKQNKLTIENIFPRYECALKRNLDTLLKDCQDFVCSNSQLILQSTGFFKACPEVIEDIVKQDNLSLSTELELITAVLNWGKESLSRNQIYNEEKFLKESINRFLKHLRVLTLAPFEFEGLLKDFSIFSGYEGMVLTRKFYDPNCDVKFPESICCITTKRSGLLLNYNVSVELSLPEQLKPVSTNPVPSTVNNITYEVKYPAKETTVQSSQTIQKCTSSPDIRKSSLASSYMHGLSQTRLRDYIFPLMENNAYFASSFHRDVKSTVQFKMKSGNFMLCGVQLKVMNKGNSTDKLDVSVFVRGFLNNNFYKSYRKEFGDNVIAVNFKKQMLLKEGNTGELEVTVSNISLDQCNICNGDEPYELNNGLDFVCELCLSSNKKIEPGFIFSIWKLIYAKC